MALPDYVQSSPRSIDDAYNRLGTTFASFKTHDLDWRTFNLKQLGYMLRDNQSSVHASLKADLDKGPLEVDMSEIYAIYNEIDLAIKRLRMWTKDEYNLADGLLAYRSLNPRVRKQPKGLALVGHRPTDDAECQIISPWNYPWMTALIPLVGAIAAGCPAVIKPSEHSPASSALLANLLPKYLDDAAFAVINGDSSQSAHLLEKQWGHILFTGNEVVGRIVATAAAKTLSPTTLELGGKSPVIVSQCANLEIGVRRMMSIKSFGMGQMCVAPDYILCPRDRIEEFVRVCREVLAEFHPQAPHPSSVLTSDKACAQRGVRDFDRIDRMLHTAGNKVVIRGEQDRATLRMGISVVLLNDGGENEEGPLAEEELFGPVICVVPVADVDQAITYVNARPHPLALYVLSRKRAVFEHVVAHTISGSATWNDFGFATIARNLPFGGVGNSGWGSYHGKDGFMTFTHRRDATLRLRYPSNMGSFARSLFDVLLNCGVSYRRPVSVEDERARRRRGNVIASSTWVAACAVLLVGMWSVMPRA